MKIRNNSGNTFFLEDIDLHLPYKEGEVETIDPDTLKKSKSLRSAIISNCLEVVDYDPNERIEASIMYLKANQSSASKSETAIEEKIEAIEPANLVYDEELNDIEVRINGLFYDAGGYAKVNRNFAFNLHKAGIKIKIDPKRSQNTLKESELKQIKELTHTKLSKKHITIDSVIPSFGEYSSGKYRILYTTIESYTVPQQFLDCCQLYDEIWVTSPWSASILKKHVNNPIYVIPAGVDPILYTEKGPRFDFKPNIKSFVFLSVFGWGYRKGYDVLLKAYFEEFDVDDDVSLLIASRYQSGTSRFHRNKIRDDINDIMRKFPNKDMPHVVRYSQIIPEQQMPQLYRAADCFVLPSRGEGSCNLPGTKIITKNGLKNIEMIMNKELVLTHKGGYHEVLKAMKRYVNEDICEINTLTHYNKICLTKDHPVLVLKKQKCWKGDRKDIKCFTYDNCEWEKASNLSHGDYLLFPVNFCKKTGLTKMPLANYLNHDEFIFENDRIFRKSSNQYSKSFKHSTAKSYLNELAITESLLKLIGFYIAEGYVHKSKITFTFHKNEVAYHREVIEALLVNFAQKTKTTMFKNTLSAQICCSNYIVSKLLSSWCGNGAYEKHLPDFIWDLNEKQIICVLYGLFSGDGCFTKKQKKSLPYLSLTTVSRRLCDEVSVLLRSIGINSRQSFNSNKTYSVNINGNQLNKLHCIKNSSHSGRSKNYCINNENYLFLPITNISNRHYEGHVYNLEVNRDNSYANNCFIVHNCLPPVEASLCGLPLIMTNVSGQQMYLRNDNAFLIEMDRLIKTPTGYFGIHYWDGQEFPDLTSQEVIDQLRKAMRYVIQHPEESQKRNRRLQKLIKGNFTWNHNTNAAIKRLKEIKEKMKW